MPHTKLSRVANVMNGDFRFLASMMLFDGCYGYRLTSFLGLNHPHRDLLAFCETRQLRLLDTEMCTKTSFPLP